MRKGMILAIACCLSVLSANAGKSSEDRELEDYIDGIGSCYAPYATDLNGFVYAADGKTQVATVRVRETRGTLNGASALKIVIEPKGAYPRVTLWSKLTSGLPCRVQFSESTGVYTADTICDLMLRGDQYVGMVYGLLAGGAYAGCSLKAVTAGVDIMAEPTVNPRIAFAGYWGVAFLPSAATGAGAEAVRRGFPFISVNFKANGKITASVNLPSGFKKNVTASFSTEGDKTVLPISIYRQTDGGAETFSCKLVWDNQYALHGLTVSQAFSVQDVSPWVSTSKTAPFSIVPIVIANGRSEFTAATFKTATADIDLSDAETYVKSSLRFAAKTGLITGSVQSSETNGKKTTKTTRTVYGVDIGGKGWGFLYKSKKSSGWIVINK